MTPLLPARDLWLLLGAAVYPLWLLAGVLDIALHRRDRIETRVGSQESAMHVAMCLQMGVPVLLVLFLDVTAPVFLACAAFVAIHSWTSWRDTRFADPRRHVGPAEQKVHVALDGIPWIGLALVALLHAPALRGLVADGAADWAIRPRRPMFAPGVVVLVLATSFLFGLLPSLLEWRRARRFEAHATH
ncbi:hypothetical protein [Lysobacter xanthus]